MSTAEIRGRFVWHELMTTDTAAAGNFYPRVAGWKSQPWEKNADYTLWVGKSGPMGGLMNIPTEAAGAPSQWMPYIGTPDIAATVATARQLGAKVKKDITPIPDMGQFAILSDPQGATFAVYAAGSAQEGAGAPPSVGDFSWHELATTDLDGALRFYTQLFGWGKGPTHNMGEMGDYQLFTQGGKQIGGIYKLHPEVTEMSHWLCYVRVGDVDKATDAAKAAGGRVLNGPMEVPGGDWIAQLVDPQGAAFAVHEIKPLAKPAAPAKSRPQADLFAEPAAKQSTAPKAKAPAVLKAKPVAARKKVVAKAAAKKSVRKAKAVKAKAGKRVAAKKRAAPAKRATARKGSLTRLRAAGRKRVAKKKVTRRLRARKRR